jgi:AAA domain
MSNIELNDPAVDEHVELAEIPWSVSEEIASWRRILHLTQGGARSNFEQACRELLALAQKHANAPDTRRAIVDALFDMGRGAGIDDDEAQEFMASKSSEVGKAAANRVDGHQAIALPGASQRLEQAPRFTPVAIDDVQVTGAPAWLVQHLLPARGLACIVGPPKSGKSFMTTDMLFAVARGVSYAGRDTLPGPVIYLTGEGVMGFKRRLIALRRHHDVEGHGVPFFMIENVPDLGSERTDVQDLLRELDQFIQDHNLGRPRAISLDTLARCMGEGDENTARDMGRFVNRCGIIERHFECAVVVVHHMGKNPAAGGRGSNALNGAADVTITVEKNEACSTVRVDEMKDGPEGQEWRFRLLPYDLSVTTDTPSVTTAETTTCIVELIGEATQSKLRETKADRPPKGVPGDLLLVIRRAVNEGGETNVPSAEVPNNTRAVSRENLKTYCRNMAWQDVDGKPESFRVMLNKTLSALRAGHLIGFNRDWVWLT